MAARPAITNVALSTWANPINDGVTSKTVKYSFIDAQAPGSAATTDTLSIGADYGLYDTTHAGNALVDSTNFKDPK